MDFKNKIRKYFKRYRVPALAALISGFSVLGGFVFKPNSAKPVKTAPKIEKVAAPQAVPPQVKNPILNIAYRTDTLDRATSTLLFYSRGSITRYYVENNNSYRMQLPYFAHENWHHHNDLIGYRTRYYFTPVEYYKLCMHDEISANIAAVLTARYEYLAAPTKAERKAVIKRYKSTYLRFYFAEVEKGKINPEQRDKKHFDAEMRFIANETQKMWLQRYAAHYAPRTYRMLQRYVARNGLVEDSKKSYSYVLNKMYNIGGVNFAEYMKADINTADDKVRLAEQLRKVKTMRFGGIDIMNHVNGSYDLMGKVSARNTTEAFQNLLIAAQLKYMLQDKSAEQIAANPQLVNLCFVKIMNQVRADKTFKEAVLNYPVIADNRVNLNRDDKTDAAAIRQMYQFKGVDLLALISSYKQEAMPIRSMEDFCAFENYGRDYISAMENDRIEDLFDEHKYFSPFVPYVSSDEASPFVKNRFSAMQNLKIPNLHEPILTAATADDYFQILQCVREFESIPQVLKECNTAAQKKYLREHPEYAKQNAK